MTVFTTTHIIYLNSRSCLLLKIWVVGVLKLVNLILWPIDFHGNVNSVFFTATRSGTWSKNNWQTVGSNHRSQGFLNHCGAREGEIILTL